MGRVLGSDIEILERGALDDYTVEEAKRLERKPGEGLLVTRLRDGTEAGVAHGIVVPLVQKRIEELERQGVELTLVLCTGRFPSFKSKRLVVYPSEILRGAVIGSIKRGKLGIVQPSKEQLRGVGARSSQSGAKPWGEEVEVVHDAASPYGPEEEVAAMAERLAKAGVDLVFLNCMGFNSRHKEIVKEKTGKPVIQSNYLVARVLKELIS
jgi:protein AroM